MRYINAFYYSFFLYLEGYRTKSVALNADGTS